MIKVYHRIDPTFQVEANPDLKNYVFVADVDTNVLEKAFELTNNIEHNWTRNSILHIMLGILLIVLALKKVI